MEDILIGLPGKIEVIAEVVGVICMIATVVVRLTPNKADDKEVNKVVSSLLTVIKYLPTIGINPRTKELERSLIAYKISDKENNN